MAIAGEKNIEAGKGISGLGCCGAGCGTWAMPYDEERLAYGSMEADQIKATGAEIVVAPRHNCRGRIMKGLSKVHDLGTYKETLYLWEFGAGLAGASLPGILRKSDYVYCAFQRNAALENF